MVICFEISETTKRELDQLLEYGNFSDYSEIVAVAVTNQVLLHKRVAAGELVIVAESEAAIGQESSATNASRSSTQNPRPAESPASPKSNAAVPAFFLRNAVAESKIRPVKSPGDVFMVGEEVPVDRWIFGQHNKLFTAKPSCRGLATLLHEMPKGVALAKAAADVAQQASYLGDFLRELDQKHEFSRDEALAVAFPDTGTESQKARLRFSNQFVASMNKNGQLSGLLVDLKLINVLGSKQTRISLTEAGLNFVRLRNPILDGDPHDPDPCRFSHEEIEFLLDHISTNVPSELSAFLTILSSLVNGEQTPDRLDQVLAPLVSKRHGKPFTDAFISTQRSGAISRMVELGLVKRTRAGVRVKYEPTDSGISYLSHRQENE